MLNVPDLFMYSWLLQPTLLLQKKKKKKKIAKQVLKKRFMPALETSFDGGRETSIGCNCSNMRWIHPVQTAINGSVWCSQITIDTSLLLLLLDVPTIGSWIDLVSVILEGIKFYMPDLPSPETVSLPEHLLSLVPFLEINFISQRTCIYKSF